jgi:hypothetical protein
LDGSLAHRAGAPQCYQGHDLLEARGAKLQQQPSHAVGLELKDAVRVPLAQHLEDLLVLEAEVIDVDVDPAVLFYVGTSKVDDREVTEPEEVHLEEPQSLDAVHVELRDHLSVLAALERKVLDERVTADDYARGVDAGSALEILDLESRVDDLLRRSSRCVRVSELG